MTHLRRRHRELGPAQSAGWRLPSKDFLVRQPCRSWPSFSDRSILYPSTVRDAALRAHATLAAQSGPARELVHVYNLIGDPATVLPHR